MSSEQRGFERRDTPGPGDGQGNRRMSFTEQAARRQEQRRAANMEAAQRNLLIARVQLENALDALTQVQGLQLRCNARDFVL